MYIPLNYMFMYMFIYIFKCMFMYMHMHVYVGLAGMDVLISGIPCLNIYIS